MCMCSDALRLCAYWTTHIENCGADNIFRHAHPSLTLAANATWRMSNMCCVNVRCDSRRSSIMHVCWFVPQSLATKWHLNAKLKWKLVFHAHTHVHIHVLTWLCALKWNLWFITMKLRKKVQCWLWCVPVCLFRIVCVKFTRKVHILMFSSLREILV